MTTTADVPRSEPKRSIVRLVVQGLRSPERKRLESDVEMWKARVDGKEPRVAKLLDLAADEAGSGDLDNGWKFLHQAQRIALEGSSDAVLEAVRVALREEATKVPEWRKSAVVKLLDMKTKEGTVKALELAHEHSDNVYIRNRLMRRQMSFVFGVLAFAVAAFIFALKSAPEISEKGMTAGSACRALLLGTIGACLSAMLTFANTSTEQSIPARLANVYITVTRPLIGATSGLVGLLMLTSGVLNLPIVSGWVVPFLFGFSERLLFGALQTSEKTSK